MIVDMQYVCTHCHEAILSGQTLVLLSVQKISPLWKVTNHSEVSPSLQTFHTAL